MLAALSPVSYVPAAAPAPVNTRAAVSMNFADEFSIEAKPWTSSEVSDKAGLEELAKKLEGTTVSIARKQGEDVKLFGSVSTKDIADALAQQGLEIDRKIVKLDGAIKSIGSHEVTVRFSQHVSVALKVNVVGV